MFSQSISTVVLTTLIASATAQTAPGFPVPATQQLTVSYGNNTVSPPGERIPRPETAQPPTISSPTWFSSPSGPTYGTLLMVDLDVPRNNTRVQLLHWLATNVTLFISPSTGEPTSRLSVNNDAAPVPYLQPSPPVGDVPHSYTFVLFQQPPNFTIPAQYANLSMMRVPFDVSKFVADAGLGEAAAGNWITVQNLTGSATASFPASRPTQTPAGNGTSEFQGGAGGMRKSVGWVSFGTVVVGVVVAALGLGL